MIAQNKYNQVNEILDPEGVNGGADNENVDDSDKDMLVTQAEVNLICPITRWFKSIFLLHIFV